MSRSTGVGDQLVVERYGKDGPEKHFIVAYDGFFSSTVESAGGSVKLRLATIEQLFRDLFLPKGYPQSVSDDYLEYQLWDTLQAFASSINGTLATHAVLKGAGVGDESATVLGATLTWLWRDGAGMLGRIVFAYARGTQLDAESKTWRLVADVLNDAAFFIDLIAPLFRHLFTLFMCASSVLRSIVGVAGSATRASLTQHQARANNLADVSAKDGSQETLVNLSALLCSLLVVPVVADNQTLVWVLFCLLTMFHIFANYRAVKCLKMESLNSARFCILARSFVDTGCVPTIAVVNEREPLFPPIFSRASSVNYGVSLELACNRASVVRPVDVPGFDQFILIFTKANGSLNVAFPHDVGVRTQLLAAFMCEFILHRCSATGLVESLVDKCILHAPSSFEPFHDLLVTNGWDTEYCMFNTDSWRYEP